MGKRSAISQKLPHQITDLYNALSNNHRIYLLKSIAKMDRFVLSRNLSLIKTKHINELYSKLKYTFVLTIIRLKVALYYSFKELFF